MKNMIRIRAHHLNCIPRFYRGGYDEQFADNMKNICNTIRKKPNVKIKIIVGKLDDLCMECPHIYKNKCIRSNKIGRWVVDQDVKISKFLKLKPNSIFRAKDIFNLSMNKVNETTIKSICKGCVYLDNCMKVGVNNSFRKDLNIK